MGPPLKAFAEGSAGPSISARSEATRNFCSVAGTAPGSSHAGRSAPRCQARGCLLNAKSSEEAQFNNAGLAWVEFGKFVYDIVDSYEFVVARDGKIWNFIEIDLGHVPASLGPDAGAGPVDKDTARDICCNRKEMRAVIPVDFGRTD